MFQMGNLILIYSTTLGQGINSDYPYKSEVWSIWGLEYTQQQKSLLS